MTAPVPINQLIKDRFSVFNVDREKRPVNKTGLGVANWQRMSYDELCAIHNLDLGSFFGFGCAPLVLLQICLALRTALVWGLTVRVDRIVLSSVSPVELHYTELLQHTRLIPFLE